MTTSRFAPSPTGRLHLGHAYSAVLGRVDELLLAGTLRSTGGRFPKLELG